MNFIAHKNNNEKELLKDHLLKTALLAKDFAAVFDQGEYAYVCGLVHDIGKYSDEFQNRIKNNGKKCDHSTAGAKVLCDFYGAIGKLLGNIVAGHHSGLLDYGSEVSFDVEGTYLGRLQKNIPNYSECWNELNRQEDFIELKRIKVNTRTGKEKDEDLVFSVYMLLKMLFSCLVDADFLKTEAFMLENNVDRKVEHDFQQMDVFLENQLMRFSKESQIGKIRSGVMQQCSEAAKMDKGIFLLTVPTGGGKTLSSMNFAIKHLLKHKMQRIIYVIPYTSIIEQNARVFKNVLGEEFVLEHHSNFDYKDNEKDAFLKQKLASENWDMPIIVTTNVQFFESLYSERTSKSRKTHNIANSIVIFDEVQVIPKGFLKPCIKMIEELVLNYKCSAVLCSATQPEFNRFFKKEIIEICENKKELFDQLNRVKIVYQKDQTIEWLSEEMNKQEQCLMVVNTKKMARELYQKLKGNEGNYHLSTYMCPIHRRMVIEAIKDRLQKGQSCKVVSTNLVEAGVDFDFPMVFRELAGLDSIIQAAGRCNRERRLSEGKVIVFTIVQDQIMAKKTPAEDYLQRQKILTKEIFENYENVCTLEAISVYYNKLYDNYGEQALDYKQILEMINEEKSFKFPLKTIGEAFKLIDEESCTVLVKYNDEAEGLIDEMKYIGTPTRGLFRKMQKYTVNVKYYEFKQLREQKKIELISDYAGILIDTNDYTEIGINFEDNRGISIFI